MTWPLEIVRRGSRVRKGGTLHAVEKARRRSFRTR